MSSTTSPPDDVLPNADVLGSLEAVCSVRGIDGVAERLGELRPWLDGDLASVDRALEGVVDGETLAHKSARHLLALRGKLLRPLCVALASRVGAGFTPAARELAIAVELVHNATLLHDDVVDLGDKRRGVEAARVVYGNAASIFGGDWLLLEALCRVQMLRMNDVLERLLAVIKDMVIAESLQLARRGRVSTSREEYFNIVQGKTASLFCWAMFAGARAGDVEAASCEALEAYGKNLGTAFQLIDDLLDLTGDPGVTGKGVLADLREGKMTYPLIVAYERHPDIGPLLVEACGGVGEMVTGEGAARLSQALRDPAVLEECFELARGLGQEAIDCLAPLPAGRARTALESVALTTLSRTR